MCTSPWPAVISRLHVNHSFASLEVVLKDPKDPSGPRVVATKKIPYYFDVTARSLPRNKKRTNAEAEHDNIGPSRKRRRTKSLSPATTFTTQLEVVPQQEGIEPQMPQGRMVGELWSIMDHPQRQQQGLNDAQNLLPADAVPRLPSTPLPHIRSSGSAGGAEIWLFGADLPENLMPFARDASVPETVRHILVADASPASGPCAQSLFTGVAGGNARDEPTCDVQIRAHALDRAWEDIPGQQGFNSLSFAPIRRLSVEPHRLSVEPHRLSVEPHSLSVEPLRIPTDTEIVCTRAIVPEREARVHGLQAKIRDLRTRFETDNQEKPDALQLITDHMHSQIFGIQNEMKDYWNAFLTKPLEAEAEVNQEEIATLLSVMNHLSDRIVAIQKEIADRRNAFSAERREAEAAVAAKIMIYIMEHENYNSASFLAPIQRLPVEILAEIFLLSRDCHLRPPLHLMHVCRRWRATMLNTPRIWVNLRLRTWTKMDEVRVALERTGASPLDVEIDTGMDVFKMVDTDKLKRYAGLELATTEAKRWRNLTITSFPTQLDINTHYKPEKPVFSGPMNALQSFKLKSICEDSVIFDQLLNVMGSSSHEKLTDMELSSPNAIYRLAQPQFASIFRRLVTFKVDVREMQEEVDILPQFEQLVTLEAYRLRLPNYPVETDLPLVRTLKYMKIKLVSVQWMSGRTFPNMMECTLISPHNPQTLAPGVGVDLPECTDFTYDDFFIDVLSNFCIPKLDTLVIRNNVLNNPRGSSQLADFWSRVAGVVASLMPRVLHLDTQRHDRHLVDAPSMLPELEGLTAPLRRPPSSGSAATSVGRTCG